MDESLAKRAFSPERAEIYDDQFVALHAIKDLMHLLVRVRFSQLPSNARILVAGAGTGAEVRFLAPLFPAWRFTLADPAEGMLAVAERHAKAEGFVERCTFHAGYVSSLPQEAHDAATSILVSQFLTDAQERTAYFKDIAARLKPGALFFNADLAAEREDACFNDAMDTWLSLMEHARGQAKAPGFIPSSKSSAPGAPSFREMFGRDLAAHGPSEVEAMMEQAGFRDRLLCYQAVLIRAWLARRE